MTRAKTVCFFTGKRGGFNHLVPIFEKIKESNGLDYCVVTADMHSSNTFGKTLHEVERWAENVYSLDTMLSGDSKVARSKSIGIGLLSCSQLLNHIRPDFVFVLGDRGEVLAMAIAAMELNIPLLHLFGGDVSQAGVDEPVRHAITKMSNIHFASNNGSAERILKMGEEPWRVHNVGSPVLDLVREKRFTPPAEIADKFNINLDEPVFLLLQHSVTWQVDEAEFQIRQTLEALDHFQNQTVAVYPCSDPGYDPIIKVLCEYESKSYLQLYKNIEFQDFWGLMNVCDAFIGNSSAGVMETASFKIPCINIGIRQEGRLRADNVIDVDHGKNQIIEAIEKALHDDNYKEKVGECVSPYGDGKASERIVRVIKNLPNAEKLIQKKMTY